jgi:NADPH2:quinone reductase
LQTAAGSALGRMVIRLAKLDGFRTINVVRRREQAEELLRLGGDAAICTADESIEERVAKITNGAGVGYALDAVGGATGSGAAAALGADGHMLLYGTLSEEPLAIQPRVLIVGNKRVEGFWLGNWARRQGVFTMLALFRQINRFLADGTFATEVGARYPLEEIQSAVRLAQQPGHTGKILLKIGNR